jgi:DNA polymerase I-like protein with 3'-5' exonuclease and polymerase domains
MSRDESMIQAIKEGKDLHSFTVSRMVPNVTYEEVVAAKKQKGADEKEEKACKKEGRAFTPKITDKQKWLLLLRQDNKAIGFGIIYGAGPPRIADSIEISDEDVQKRIDRLIQEEANAPVAYLKKGRGFSSRVKKALKNNPLLTEAKAVIQVARQSIAAEKIQAYFDSFPGVQRYMKYIPEMCRENMEWTESIGGSPRQLRDRPKDANGNYLEDGQKYDWDTARWTPGQTQPLTRTGHEKRFGVVHTLCGRYRRLEDINHSNYRFKSEAERQAVNTIIQGSAADITKAAMLRVDRDDRLREIGCELLNQIHDELVSQVPEQYAEEALEIIKECMEHPFAKGIAPLSVPIPADGKVASSWSEK